MYFLDENFKSTKKKFIVMKRQQIRKLVDHNIDYECARVQSDYYEV